MPNRNEPGRKSAQPEKERQSQQAKPRQGGAGRQQQGSQRQDRNRTQ